jgi:Tat protein translocase TatB subunit
VLGVSFSEIVMIAIVALVVVGPRRLPEILGQMGRWVAKIRRMTTEVRKQTGIDEILREEGISGGINELRATSSGTPRRRRRPSTSRCARTQSSMHTATRLRTTGCASSPSRASTPTVRSPRISLPRRLQWRRRRQRPPPSNNARQLR